uniref:Myb-like domain-containing protein n=1 Tax=Cacopsylla melanoneura TaxID=428564 RepID=A0A8D8WHA3_9HEMI
MLKIRTPWNLNEEATPPEGPTCSVPSDPSSLVNDISKPVAPLKASSTSMYIKSNDDFLLSIFEEDTAESSSKPNTAGSPFKQPYPVSLKQANYHKPLRNKKRKHEETILSTNEDYREDDISLHMEVEQAVMPENPPYKRRPYSGKPRRQRSRKEDVPLAERIRNRLITVRKKEAIEESQGDVNPDSEPWCEEEKMNLLRGLKEVGHFDYELLQTYVPTRSTDQVKKFFWCHKARHKAKVSYRKHFKPNTSYIMRRTSADNLDVTVSFRRNRTNPDPPLFSQGEHGDWWSCFLADIEHQTEPEYLRGRRNLMRRIHRRAGLGHALYMIREYEEHPIAEETGGVDLKLAYHFLWACFTQQTPPPIDPTTRSFLVSQYDVLVQSSLTNSKMVAFMDNFKRDIDDYTMRDPLDTPATEDEERHFTKKGKSKSQASPYQPSPSPSESQAESEQANLELWSGGRQRGWYSKFCSLKKRSYRDANFLFKHSLDDNEPIENQVCPSAEFLRNSIFNPLSIIPMDILKK